MIYSSIDLRTTALIVGAVLVLVHAAGLWQPESTGAFLRGLPRSRTAGVILLTMAGIWSFVLVTTMDLGEFTGFRFKLEVLVVAAYFLTLNFVDEFLAVRAAGMLFLLMADPLLEAAFLRPETGRLLLVVLAYVWVLLGTFWVGMPYLMRDQIAWVSKSRTRWQLSCLAGILYGVALLTWLATQYRSA